MNNAWISMSAPVILVHAYFSITNPITKEALGFLERYHDIIRWSSIIFRFSDDLGTSSVCSLIIRDCFGLFSILTIHYLIIIILIYIFFSQGELKRGDAPKSIQCYMHETGASEDDARKYIGFLIDETWKKMNEDRNLNSPFPQTFIGVAMNVARMAQCMYQYGDGYGVQDRETKDRIMTLFIEPISLT